MKHTDAPIAPSGGDVAFVLEEPGHYRVRCSAHAWETVSVTVVDAPSHREPTIALIQVAARGLQVGAHP